MFNVHWVSQVEIQVLLVTSKWMQLDSILVLKWRVNPKYFLNIDWRSRYLPKSASDITNNFVGKLNEFETNDFVLFIHVSNAIHSHFTTLRCLQFKSCNLSNIFCSINSEITGERDVGEKKTRPVRNSFPEFFL